VVDDEEITEINNMIKVYEEESEEQQGQPK
jgi:hypothetical protein